MNGPKSLSVFDAALGSPQAQQICGVPFGRALRMRRQKARRGHGFPRRHGFDVTANPLTARFCFPLDCWLEYSASISHQMMHPSISMVLHGPAAEFLIARALPAMVYFFFVFYGGQRAAVRSKPKTAKGHSNLIDRFLNGTICIFRNGAILSSAGTRIACWTHTVSGVGCETCLLTPPATRRQKLIRTQESG
jgi:hypothetical protein